MKVFLQVVFSVATVGGLGILFGIFLAVMSNILAVKRDERIVQVDNALPGVNCGTCGFAGCAAYAEAIVIEGAELTLCAPGGAETIDAIAGIMGRQISVEHCKNVAQVHCRGGRETSQYTFEYKGVKDCNALHALFGGDKVCPYGCLAQGSCIKVCPVDAIDYDTGGLVWVDKELCIGCGKCIDVCPTMVMKFMPYDGDDLVACNSTDKGPLVRKYCSVGCIGCKLCVKQSPGGGFVVENFLATIDYKCGGERFKATEKCPPKCIIKNI